MDVGGAGVRAIEIRLYKGDCLDFIPALEDGTIDLILTDPPYSSGGLFAGDRKQSTGVKYADNKFHGAYDLDDFSGDNMDQRSFTAFMRELLRLAQPTGYDGRHPDGRACVARHRRMEQGRHP